MYLDNTQKGQCCGCAACSYICPVSAIKMQEDERGFFYPMVNLNKCIKCNRCQKVCPMEKNYVEQKAEPLIYAAKNRNEETLNFSSSGGIYSLLAQWILEQKGIVYGAAFDEKFSVRHMRATSMEEAVKFRGSKYVESDLSDIYPLLIKDLKNGKTVLFTGTPCQVSAITEFLNLKQIDTAKLYTCDNICHGVPSRKVWVDYINILKNKYIPDKDNIIFINMRSKKKAWETKTIDIKLENGNIDNVINKMSFNRLYESLLLNRLSCFQCKYTSYKRCSDLTLGDFWNADNIPLPFDIKKGISSVIINTAKGKMVFEKIRTKMCTHELSKKQCWQPHLEYSAKRPTKQDQFWHEYNLASDKEVVIRKYLNGSLLTQFIRRVSPFLRKTGLYGMAGKLYKVLIVRKSD